MHDVNREPLHFTFSWLEILCGQSEILRGRPDYPGSESGSWLSTDGSRLSGRPESSIDSMSRRRSPPGGKGNGRRKRPGHEQARELLDDSGYSGATNGSSPERIT
jgi:hypothetical protein